MMMFVEGVEMSAHYQKDLMSNKKGWAAAAAAAAVVEGVEMSGWDVPWRATRINPSRRAGSNPTSILRDSSHEQ